jgi:methylase of polypeptide subunit release factors
VALFGGPNGIELLARFLGEAHDIVTSDGELCVELDEEAQAAPISALARTVYPTASVSVCRDAGGYDRVVRVLMQSL